MIRSDMADARIFRGQKTSDGLYLARFAGAAQNSSLIDGRNRTAKINECVLPAGHCVPKRMPIAARQIGESDPFAGPGAVLMRVKSRQDTKFVALPIAEGRWCSRRAA